MTGTAPELPAGSVTFICHNPANPGAKPAKPTVAGDPPTVAVTGAITYESEVELAGEPVGTAGDTAPKPVPNRSIACPAPAGLLGEFTE
jgi:hypothetical protein